MTKTAAAVALAAALAQPALATTVYVPFADRLESGATQHRLEIGLTNKVAGAGQSVTYRVFVDGRAGAAQSLQVGPGQSRAFAPSVPMGSSGLIEINLPSGVDAKAKLQFERRGNAPGSFEMPAFVAASAAPAGQKILLDGLEVSSAKDSSYSIVNLDAKSATCSVQFLDADAKPMGKAFDIQVPGKSSHREQNIFAGVASGTLQGAMARLSCNSRFWAYGIVEETATGETQLLQPAMLLEPVSVSTNSVSGAVQMTFSKPGTFLISDNTNLNWVFRMAIGSAQTFRKVVADYDFFVNIWDPKKPSGTHEVMWFQKGTTWRTDMMAYVNSTGSKSGMRYKTLYGFSYAATLYPGLKQKTNYHMHYEWDGTLKKNFYNILYNGNVYTKGSTSTGKTSFTTTLPFIGMGGQTACSTCPESKCPGWTFSNLTVTFYP